MENDTFIPKGHTTECINYDLMDEFVVNIVKQVEEWVDIKGYEGDYRISTLGRIYSCKTNKILSPWINNRGYLCIKLYRKGIREEWKMHVIVAKAFVKGETKLKNEVHHLDFDKENNLPDNLKWCTRKQNMKYNYACKKYKSSNIIQGPF